MTSPRLDIALAAQDLQWPEGPIVAFRPDPGQSGLPADRTLVVHGFKPAHDAWLRAGYDVAAVTPGSSFGAAYVAVPRAKDHAYLLLKQTLDHVQPGGLIAVDGAKTDGIESIAKALKPLGVAMRSLSKAHGKLLWFQRPQDVPSDVFGLRASKKAPAGWRTAPGVFSADAIDKGSEILSTNLPRLSGRGADFGAGWGYLSVRLLEVSNSVEQLDLLEAEWAALTCARENVTDARARFHWVDATSFETEPYDFVIMNPPFHTSRKADPSLGQRFVEAAARVLKRTGGLTLVANRHLPYEAVLSKCFAEVAVRAEASGFKVIHASKPRPQRGR
ncbi:MAG: class I SAM-dependent methyltransferase [Pseudomonadota bacterium]